MSLSKYEDFELQTACGIFGCLATGEWPTNLDVAHIIYLGLIALQHRGQESCGITTSNGDLSNVNTHKMAGLVTHAFKEEDLAKLKGNLGIGHTRYSTAGGTQHLNTQPFVVHTKHGVLAIAHNGELVNAPQLRREIIEKGVGLSTESDSELMVQILCMPPPEPNNECEGKPDWPARIKNLMSRTKTSYALLIMNGDTIYAVRDPYGNRPLCIGKLVPPRGSLEDELINNRDGSLQNGNGTEDYSLKNQCAKGLRKNGEQSNLANGHTFRNGVSHRNAAKDLKKKDVKSKPTNEYDTLQNAFCHLNDDDESELEGYVVSSESCAFPSVAGRLVREVEPGEIVEITKKGIRSICILPRPKGSSNPAFCIFEYVYFARPDSMMEGQMVYTARMECGRQLAIQAPIEADVVSAVPESATPAAIGYAEQAKIPYMEVLCKNRYVGRTFIQPSTRLRQLAVLKKFGPLSANFKGKRIVLIDDSIVRGNTMGAIIRMLREAGAEEVHIRIASPPLHHPCYMGINIPTREELIANKLNADQLAEQIGANSLVYLDVANLKNAVKANSTMDKKSERHCTACLTGEYPVALEW
ncbi:amidophosphoribosyltransferase isoform X2 [Parasteatoda tepidariorum]|uniref:amidophosphoribosyltransferase isoform X2 n=1 Tax=Parasteatoda tepidariorum TaxID=114398 RepID=UPI00077FCC45|nr:amidophosphoribosyltransferase isoform X2 [Parasteatoda tepidariorum]